MGIARCMFCDDQYCTDLDPLQLMESQIARGPGSDSIHVGICVCDRRVHKHLVLWMER